MYRLIYKEADGDLTCRSRDFDKVFPTLYEYEESGLTPEQAKTLGANLDAMTGLAQDLTDKLDQVKKERDAALADLNEARPCALCAYHHDPKVCRTCRGNAWTWRGAKDNNVPGKQEG